MKKNSLKKNEKSNDIVEKQKKKRKKIRIWYWLLIFITIMAILVFFAGVAFCYYIVTSAPEFDSKELYEKEATLIYDKDKNLIATLGVEKREKLTYDELPEVLIDAIIATEDSRYFQHKGFDLPRFLKATAGQLMGQAAGGASTLTMQLSKLTYTSFDSEGIAGIIRKFTDIYMAVFKIERKYNKQQIIEFYVNTPCLGGNIYGVEQAALYYFGKNAKDLNLVEAAMIAGMFQSPNGYNPYINPNDANDRKNTVLYLMKRHGYITDAEYEAGTSVEIKDFLAEGSQSIDENIGFIDTVVQEVIDRTGNNPYEVPMIIYSTMDAKKQNVINNFYKTYKFKNKKVQVGVGVIDNKTGAILAVGAGRNKTSAMTLNVATFHGQTKRHPGSTIKPILDYGPAIEYENWGTYSPCIDEKTKYGTGYMRNVDGGYKGFVTMKYALSMSRNTCALQAFNATTNEQKMKFIKSLGIEPEEGIKVLPQSYSIGAFNGVSPVQLAAAYAAFGNGGYYTEPYSFTKLEYRETEEIYEVDVSKNRVMKPQTAYIISNILTGATNYRVRVSGTQIATKTGTTSYDNNLLDKYNLSSGVIPDSWTSSYTKDHAVAIWYGYTDGLTKDTVKKKYYLTNSHASTERFKIQEAIVEKIYGKNTKFKNPGGISSSKVEMETIPAQKPSDATPKSLIETHLFISGTEPSEVSTRFSKLSNPTDANYTLNGNNIELSWTSPGIPSAVDTEYLTKYFNNGYTDWAEQYLKERLSYNKKKIGDFGFAIYLTSGDTNTYVGWTADSNYTIDMSNYNGTYDGVLIKSTYSIFKTNASKGVKLTFNVSGSTNEENYEVSMNNLTTNLNVGSSFKELSSSDVSSITLNGIDIKGEIKNLSVITNSISKSDDSTWNGTPEDITSASGTYTISYSVSFDHMSNTNISKTITQTVVVK